MWNKLSVIWHGISGHFRGFHPVESRYWLFVIGSLVSLVILLVNSSVSFSFYRFNVLSKAVGLTSFSSFVGAVLLTFVLAFAAWVLLAWLAYLLSAKLNNRKIVLVGISKSDVAFSILGILFLAGLDVFANWQGVEEIAMNSTSEHMADPTLQVDTTFSNERNHTLVRLDQKRETITREIAVINSWTGKNHSCTKTKCPTKARGKGTIGAHWKGTLTAFGSKTLEAHKRDLSALDEKEAEELEKIEKRRTVVSASLVGAYQKDVNRYTTELTEKNRTLKGFVLIAYPFSFVIEFLLAGICFMALEYLYETKRLKRPTVSVYQNGTFRRSPTVEADNRKHGDRGYEIECLQCGTVTVKKHPRAKFCSDKCRYEYHGHPTLN